jgi:hypothetical protein
VAALAGALIGAGCAGGGTGGAGGTGGSGGGAGGASGGAGGSAPAGACPARPELVVAAPACNTVTNAATAIPFSQATGTAPAPAGGTIQDGLYEATRTELYGATTGGGRRITFVITGGATHMLWAGEVLDATGTAVVASFRADTSIAVSGTSLAFTLDCTSSTPSPIPPALDFTATGQTLVLSLVTNNGLAVTTYTRRGCAP